MVESHHHHVPWQSLPRTALLHISRHLDGDSSSSSSPSSSSSSTTFSSTVFWTVNAIWIAVVLGLLLWCWKCGGAERLTGWIHQHNNRHDSDAHFAQVVRERQQEQQQQGQEQQLDTPQQRKQALLQSFQQHQVTMVVTAKDFVPEQVDGAPAAAAAAATLVEHDDNKNDNNNNNNNNTNPWDALEAGLVQHHNNYTNHNTHEEEASHKVGVAKQLKHENEVEPQRSLSSLSVAAAPPVDTTLVRQQCQDNNDRGLDQVEEEKEASNNNETSSACRDDRTADNNNNNSIDTMDLEEGFTNNDKDRESAQDDDDDDADDEQDWNNHLAIMNDFEMDAAESGFIVLPKQQGTVPNCCAVCLCPYEEGESLVWSSNGNCRHAFHEECIVDWLVKMKDGAPCPCCRQPFADLGEPKKKKKVISWDATRSMDPSVIRLR